ncbi:hypothetical protein T484DRAFT_1816305 [Baffinella frigidus]|nr:hypothetical protein T484DRAFT_1816305 [Cryptophyta sp. CCMP2293]
MAFSTIATTPLDSNPPSRSQRIPPGAVVFKHALASNVSHTLGTDNPIDDEYFMQRVGYKRPQDDRDAFTDDNETPKDKALKATSKQMFKKEKKEKKEAARKRLKADKADFKRMFEEDYQASVEAQNALLGLTPAASPAPPVQLAPPTPPAPSPLDAAIEGFQAAVDLHLDYAGSLDSLFSDVVTDQDIEALMDVQMMEE